MALPATEPFTGTGALSSSWTVSQGTVDRLSDQGRGATGANFSSAYWNADSFNQDQYSKFVAAVLGSGGTDYFAACCRMSGSGGTLNGYAIFMDSAGDTDYFKCTNGSWTSIGAETFTPSINDVIELRATGGTTTHLQLYNNGSPVGSGVDDSTSPHTTGAAGIAFFHTGSRIDNWEGGNVGAGPVAQVTRPMSIRRALSDFWKWWAN